MSKETTTAIANRRPPRFVKGRSGNPGGRPKGIRTLVRKHVGENGEKVIEGLMVVAFGTPEEQKKYFGREYRSQDSVAALVELRDMGFGRPAIVMDVRDESESRGPAIVVMMPERPALPKGRTVNAVSVTEVSPAALPAVVKE